MKGTTLADGRYLIGGPLGTGGMASVYRATDTRLHVERAIKVLDPKLARSSKLLERFEREARVMAKLEHPNVVPVHDVGREGKTVYLVMSLLHGGSLADHLDDHGPLPARDAAAATLGVVRALEAAHAQGVIHRDVKPQNVLIDTHGEPRLSDFGIAHVQSDRSLTNSGAQMGTWAFMPPEQRAGQRIDGRADVYAAGATLLNLLTGQLPHELHQPEAHEAQFADLPSSLTSVVAKATRFRREDRYPSMSALREALEEVVAELPYTAPRPLAATPAPTRENTTNETLVGWQTGGSTPPAPERTVHASPTHAPYDTPAPPASRREAAPSTGGRWGLAAVVLLGGAGLAMAGLIGSTVAWQVWQATESMPLSEPTDEPVGHESEAGGSTASAQDPPPEPDQAVDPSEEPQAPTEDPVLTPVPRANSEPMPPVGSVPDAEPTPVERAGPQPEPPSQSEPVLPHFPVTITSVPWSNVTIDGEPKGTTQWIDELAPGRYTVRLTATGHPELLRVLTVADGPLAFCWDFSAQAVCAR